MRRTPKEWIAEAGAAWDAGDAIQSIAEAEDQMRQALRDAMVLMQARCIDATRGEPDYSHAAELARRQIMGIDIDEMLGGSDA